MTNLNMKRIHHKKYEAMGFVEALIAIIVVGVASVVLMQIAATTMSDAVENERIDKMTQYAIEGATMTENIVQELYEDGPSTDLNSFKNIVITPPLFSEICFVPQVPDFANPDIFDFKRDGSNYYAINKNAIYINEAIDESITQDVKSKSTIFELKQAATESTPSDYFRLACIRAKAVDPKYLSVTIIVGHIPSEGTITARRNVKDYTYSTIINLNP